MSELNLNPESWEFRIFWGLDSETDEVETQNVWSFGLQWLGTPPQALGMRILFYGTPDGYQAETLGFDVEQARLLHKTLGSLLEQLNDPGP